MGDHLRWIPSKCGRGVQPPPPPPLCRFSDRIRCGCGRAVAGLSWEGAAASCCGNVAVCLRPRLLSVVRTWCPAMAATALCLIRHCVSLRCLCSAYSLWASFTLGSLQAWQSSTAEPGFYATCFGARTCDVTLDRTELTFAASGLCLLKAKKKRTWFRTQRILTTCQIRSLVGSS